MGEEEKSILQGHAGSAGQVSTLTVQDPQPGKHWLKKIEGGKG